MFLKVMNLNLNCEVEKVASPLEEGEKAEGATGEENAMAGAEAEATMEKEAMAEEEA